MVRAILEGRKTQTRRVVKSVPEGTERMRMNHAFPGLGVCEIPELGVCRDIECPHGQPGDRLWVREDFCFLSLPYRGFNTPLIQFAADGERRKATLTEREVELFCQRKHPHRKTNARFMYRSCSRLTLEITNIRVERLADISADDALAEGIQLAGRDTEDVCAAYRTLWNSIHGQNSWDLNPYVWVITFEEIPQAPAQAKSRKVKP